MYAHRQSPSIIAANRELLISATRARIAASRRLLNPFFNVSGGSDASLNDIARALLGCGNLAPIRSNVTWAGKGSGGTCGVCGEPVKNSDIEYEVQDEERRAIGCHFACFIAWQEESRNLALG